MGVGISVARAIEENGFVATTTLGNSMYPMLRNRRDLVVIKRPSGELCRHDVVLYKCEDRYILHRVIKTDGDICIIRGDNCIKKEYIQKKNIIGVVECFERNGKSYDCKTDKKYRLYCTLWQIISPLRILLKKIKLKAYKIYRKTKDDQ